MTDQSLDGRTALVTGGSRGLGFAIARALLERGARVALLARDEAAAKSAADHLVGDTGGEVLTLTADVADGASVVDAVEQAARWRGRLDVVVNNAGPQLVPNSLGDTDPSVIASAIDVKLLGFARVASAALPLLSRDGTGSVVNVAGATAHALVPNAGATAIVNAAVVAFTSYLATEAAAHNVRVNTLSPGMTKTEGWLAKHEAAGRQQGKSPEEVRAAMVQALGIRLGRWAEPEEIGRAACFLASDESSYMTGQVLRVDGGLTRPVV